MSGLSTNFRAKMRHVDEIILNHHILTDYPEFGIILTITERSGFSGS